MEEPWSHSGLKVWLENLIAECIKDSIPEVTQEVLSLITSPTSTDELQWPLIELLGDNSFEQVSILIDKRDSIKEAAAFLTKPKSPSKPIPPVQPAAEVPRTAPLTRGRSFTNHETVNGSFYDVEATDIQKPKIDRLPRSILPEWARPSFASCETFNNIQTIVFDKAFNSNENMLICAPTGAGKTNVALLTIMHELQQHIIIQPGMHPYINDDDFLIVYITPMKALAAEITEKFKIALRNLRVVVREYTGDTRFSSQELERSQLLVATPEKWDVATRKAGENAPCNRITLLIIDEIHLLQDARGPVLEALVARTLRQVEQSQKMIRIIGLSATLPNAPDVAQFLRVPQPSLFIFGPEYRPVPLAMTLVGAKNTAQTPSIESQNIYKESFSLTKEKDLAQIDVLAVEMMQKILDEGKQVLIFVHSRGETSRFANLLAAHLDIQVSKEMKNLLQRRHLQSELTNCLAKGIGIHHAGLPRSDRNFVENAFRSNVMSVLVCTATLAWGVNLPAHTVLIKGTQVYNHERGGFEDIGILDVIQMFGRAGRPQFDSSGHAILITQAKVLPKYTTTLVNQEPIESQFGKTIEDFLNAEISLGTVTCKADAMRWLRYTFMYQRHPNNELHLQRLEAAIRELNANWMIRTQIQTESLQPTHLGQVASMHYIPFGAVRQFNETFKGDMDESELLDAVFSSSIFESLIVRKSELRELDSFETFIPLHSPTEEIAGKVNVLFQSYISRQTFHTSSLALDQNWIGENIPRIFDAIFELCIERGWCYLAMFALDVCKMVDHKMCWVGKRLDHPLRQIFHTNKHDGLLKKLQMFGLDVSDLKSMLHSELKAMLGSEQMADDAISAGRRFPCLELGARYQPMSDSIVNIIIEVVFPFEWDTSIVYENEYFWIFIQDADGEHMYIAQEVSINRQLAKEGLKFEMLVPMAQSHKYIVSMTSVRFLGVGDQQQVQISAQDRITYEHFESDPPKLRPLPVSVLNDPEKEKIFPFEYFNPTQTQLFFQAFHTDDSILLCAPTAAGKTVIAELTLLRLFENNPKAKAVYIVPLKAIVQERVLDWKKKFGDKLIELTGDFTPDSAALAKSQLIVATPEKWDAVSRGFVVRQFVQQVQLLIIDEVHLLGTSRGHIIEAVVDRMYSMPTPLRILGLSTCLSNPLDVAKFLRIPERGIYNYNSNTRAVRLRTFIRGFPGRHYCPRMAAMNKPLSDAIREYSQGKPTLVFASSRRQTRQTALDLIMYANMNGEPFVFQTPEAVEAASQVVDEDLAHCLSFGVGLHNAGLLPHDQQIVEKLFASGKLQLLVATSTLAWGVNLPAHFVVIKGTEYRDPRTCQYVPYTITEMQQMMGRAGRPQFDTEGIVMILCEESRKDFLKKFINAPFPVESSLLNHVAEHVNAEVACGRIRSKHQLIEWIKRSYFALRLQKNPKYYNNITIEQVAVDTIKELQDDHCLKATIDGDIIPTPGGRLGSIFYVSPKTIKLFHENMFGENTETIPKLLELLCKATEFQYTPLRHSEDDLVLKMHPRFKTTMSCDDPHTKALYMIQYYLMHKKMPIVDFETDLATVLDNALRVVSCFSEMAAISKNLKAIENAAIIGQMIVQGLWWDMNPLEPLLGVKMAKQIPEKTLPEFILKNHDPRFAKLGIKDKILLYKPTFSLDESGCNLKVQLTRVSGVIGSNVISRHFNRKPIQSAYILLGDPANNLLLAHRRIQFSKDEQTIVMKTSQKIPPNSWLYIFSDAYIGIDQMYCLDNAIKLSAFVKQPDSSDDEEELKPKQSQPKKKTAKDVMLQISDKPNNSFENIQKSEKKKDKTSQFSKYVPSSNTDNTPQNLDSNDNFNKNDNFNNNSNNFNNNNNSFNNNNNKRGRGKGRGASNDKRGSPPPEQFEFEENLDDIPISERGRKRGGKKKNNSPSENNSASLFAPYVSNDQTNQTQGQNQNQSQNQSQPVQEFHPTSSNNQQNERGRGRGNNRRGRNDRGGGHNNNGGEMEESFWGDIVVQKDPRRTKSDSSVQSNEGEERGRNQRGGRGRNDRNDKNDRNDRKEREDRNEREDRGGRNYRGGRNQRGGRNERGGRNPIENVYVPENEPDQQPSFQVEKPRVTQFSPTPRPLTPEPDRFKVQKPSHNSSSVNIQKSNNN